jgi:hypothetical protein
LTSQRLKITFVFHNHSPTNIAAQFTCEHLTKLGYYHQAAGLSTGRLQLLQGAAWAATVLGIYQQNEPHDSS